MIRVRYSNQNYMEENTYLLLEEESREAAIVDPGCFPERLREALSGYTVRYVLLTHAHGDHIAALPELRELYPEAELVAHFDEKDLLSDERINGSVNMLGRAVTDDADRYVIDGETLSLGNSVIRVIATPGHTKGGVCYYTEEKLFSGDTLFRASIGRTDLYGGNFDAIVCSIREKLYALPDDTIVYPGHGEPTSIAFEKRMNPFV